MKFGAVWNWYQFGSKYSLDILAAYVKSVETQITRSVQHYSKNKKRAILKGDFGMEEEFEYYGGLESMTWDLDHLFRSRFPNLQRKAAFLALYSFLEYELNRLAKKLQAESKLVIGFEEMTGQGVKRSLLYMEKVVRLSIDEQVWGKIGSLNILRNLIIHNNGKIVDHGGVTKQEAKSLKQLRPYVSFEDDEVVLEPAFLGTVISRFDQLFKYLNDAINQKYEPKRRRVTSFKRTMRERKKKNNPKSVRKNKD